MGGVREHSWEFKAVFCTEARVSNEHGWSISQPLPSVIETL